MATELHTYINSLTEDSTPDVANDFVVTRDASASGAKKVKIANLTSILRSYLAADATYNNNATLANTNLSVTVVSSGKYSIEVVAHVDNAARDIAFDFGGTATMTNFIGQWEQYLAGDGSVVALGSSARITSAGTDFQGNSDGASSMVVFKGSMEVNAGGTFILRAAQWTANASDTTLKRGSTLTVIAF